MKIMKNLKYKIAAVLGSAICFCGHQVQAQNIFIDLTSALNGGNDTGTLSINAPAGYNYSAAAPVVGTTWNTFDVVPVELPVGTTVGTYNLFTTSALQDSVGSSLSPTLNISETVTATTTHANPTTGTGENVIQPGGVMAQAWRNYNNSSGFYITYTIAGLAASTPFNLYVNGGTTTSGQGTQVTLAAGNVLGANPGSGATADTTQNYNGAYGSLFTSVDGGTTFELMASGTTWFELEGQSDASGNFSFEQIGTGSQAYLNGFQIVPAPEPTTFALFGLGALGFAWRHRRPRR
jgi:hypothetical protein